MKQGSYLRELLSLLHFAACEESNETIERWVNISHFVAHITEGGEFALDAQSIGELDVLLIALEKEFRDFGSDNSPVDYSLNHYANLSRAWVGQAYELARSIRQRLSATPKSERKAQISEDFLECYRLLEATRVVLFKREIAGGAKILKTTPIVLRREGSEELIPYTHGMSVMAENMKFFPTLGCVGWHVFGAELSETGVIVSRAELSEKLLIGLEGLNSGAR